MKRARLFSLPTLLLLLYCALIAPKALAASGAPVIYLDGQAVTSSPVMRQGPVTLNVTMTTEFPSGSIFYTLDGSEPTGASTRYTGAFVISSASTSTTTIRALAYSLDFSQSAAANPVVVQITVPTYTIVVEPGSGGTVSKTPDAETYSKNTIVQVEAHPLPGFAFKQWIGSLGFTAQNPLSITVTDNVTLTAEFNRKTNWTFNLSGIPKLAVDQNDNVILAIGIHALKVTKSGTLAWDKTYFNVTFTDVAVDRDGNARLPCYAQRQVEADIWFFSWEIAILTPDGSFLPIPSEYQYIGAAYYPEWNLAIAATGPSYFSQYYWLAAIDPGGQKLWTVYPDIGAPGSLRAAVGSDFRIFVEFAGANTNQLYCANTNGQVQWSYFWTNQTSLAQNPILGGEALYFLEAPDTLAALSFKGEFKWRFKADQPIQMPSIGADGSLYFGEQSGTNFYRVGSDGALKGKRQPGSGSFGIPAIGSDGTIYVTDAHSLLALDALGDVLWKYDEGAALTSPVIAGTNIYVASAARLISIPANADGPAVSPWPMVDATRFGDAQAQEVKGYRLDVTRVTPTTGDVVLDPPPINGVFQTNQSVQLTATPKDGWKFLHWEGALSGTSNPATIVVNEDKTVTAVFGTSLTLTPSDHGTIHSSLDSTTVLPGASVLLAPIPGDGYYFSGWSGDISGSLAPYFFTVTNASPVISAQFLPLETNQVTLTAYSANPDRGVVRIDYRYQQNAGLPFYTKPDGRFLQAIPNPGWTFTGWTGDLTGFENPAAVRLDSSMVIVAHFAPGFSVNAEAQDGGSIARTPDQPSYASNSVVNVQAVPQPGFTFAGWITPSGPSRQNPLSITVKSDFQLVAKFDTAPRQPTWTFPLAVAESTALAADQGGNAIAIAVGSGSGAGQAARILKDGTGAWQMTIDPTLKLSDVGVDSDDNIRIAGYENSARGVLSNILPNGTVQNNVELGAQTGEISIGFDGSIFTPLASPPYFLRAISGISTKWTFGESSPVGTSGTTNYSVFSRPAVGVDGRLFLLNSGRLGNGNPSGTNSVDCLNPDGQLQWSFGGLLTNSIPPTNAPVLGKEAVYVIDRFGWLLSLTRDGVRQWRFQTIENVRLPSIGSEGELYFGAVDGGRFFSVNPDRSTRWERRPGRGHYGLPAIGADGTIYVTDHEDGSDVWSLQALDRDGNRLWSFSTNSALSNPIIAGTNIYIATRDQLIAFSASASGSANSPWPMANASPFGDAQEQKIEGVRLKVDLVMPFAGSVAVSPQPIGGVYSTNQTVKLTATPSGAWKFLHWEGDLSGITNPTTIVLDTDKSVHAIFGTSITVIPPNHGTIQSNFDLAAVPVAATLILTPIGEPGFYFVAWGGDGIGSANPLMLSVNDTDLVVSALFEPIDGPVIDPVASSLESDGFHLVIHGTTGHTIQILHSTDLLNWQVIHTETTTDGNLTFVHPLDGQSPHFYRAGY